MPPLMDWRWMSGVRYSTSNTQATIKKAKTLHLGVQEKVL